MCDLSQSEREAILGRVKGLEELVTRIRASAQSIEDRNWMEHDDLDRLLTALSTETAGTQTWVHQKMAATHG